MKSILLAIATLGVSIISAQQNIVSVTSPLQGTTYTAGQSAIIAWTNPQVDTISQIVLAHGNPSALQPLSTIATNVDASAMKYTWNIPADLAAGVDYALEFGTSPNLSYAGPFTIKAADGSLPSSSVLLPLQVLCLVPL
ncbi:uncharacterized protein BX664DRAFT_1859 [Halteromyces radiatus]|uniref:uncharacterized protein n=1 Tax=Halteromyces radiatus TaxID=101107 RepID=UPI00222020B2|nr:uncharacterized protein BX664DRAFT_1859 [Halteromyces radiatus]KAI8098530.1 hypothetical protein BX664DRAFT_1859 [Halteromyces radiatus]